MNTTHRLWTKDYTVFWLTSLLMLFAFYSLVSTLPLYLDEYLHATKGQIGLILSFYAVGALLLRPFCGYALDVWGRKGVFLSGFFIFCLLFGLYQIPSLKFFSGLAILGLPVPLLIVSAVRFLHGLSWAIVSSGSQTLTVDLVPASRRGEGIAYHGLSVSISLALGPVLGLWLIDFFSAAHLFAATMILSLLSFFAMSLFMKFPAYRPQRARINLRMLIEKTSLPISLVNSIFFFSNGAITTFIPIYSKEIEGVRAASFFFVFALSMAAIRVISGKMFDRMGARIPLALGFPMAIVGSICLALARGPWLYHAAAILIGLGQGMIFPCFVACINNMVRVTRRGAANATFSSSIDVGIGLGIIFFGYLADRMGFRVVYGVVALVYLLSYLVYLLGAEKHYLRNRLKEEDPLSDGRDELQNVPSPEPPPPLNTLELGKQGGAPAAAGIKSAP
ncbi:MAG TPA: MFS transporter [Verrucomicrobiota bacterium]|nr:MFS transporter [Verrucomicrobiota bacterium]